MKNQHSCGLLLDVVSDVIELKYESHVDILYDSLAYKDSILVINGACEMSFQLSIAYTEGIQYNIFVQRVYNYFCHFSSLYFVPSLLK